MLWEIIRNSLIKYSDKVFSDGNQTITYAEMLSYAESSSSKLKNSDLIGILCDNELNSAKLLLACFAAGKAAVPLSFRYGLEHCARIIKKISLKCVVTDKKEISEMACGTADIINIDSSKYPSVETEDLPSGTALIMCTSGTTGEPKGAMISYRNLYSNLMDISKYFLLEDKDRILIARPLYHCAVLTGELLISILKGLDIYFYNYEFNPVKLINTVKSINANVLCGTPTLFYHICNLIKRMNGKFGIEKAAISGECMTKAAAELINEYMPDCCIYNVYGLTEASPRVAYLPSELFKMYPEAVGLPLNSVKLRIVDPDGNDVPAGGTGELIVKGPNVMQGYFRDEEATKKSIREDWLFTGDIACIDDNGLLYIKSRKDNMIIRAGMNIYPQEIENALKSNKDITEVLAYGISDGKSSQKIYIKAVTNGLSKHDVFRICRELLPSYQMPDHIEIADSLDKNASGKILRPKERCGV